MQIISSQIVRNHNRGNGSRVIHEQHIDHLGIIHEYRYKCPLDYEVNIALSNRAVTIESSLIFSEIEKTKNEVLNKTDPSTMVFKYLNEVESVRAIMSAFLTGQAVGVIHMLAWVQSFSVPDLNALGFTTEERGQISSREGTINGVKSLLETDALFILDEF